MLCLDRPLQGLDDVPQVVRHGGLAGVRVVGPEGVEDGLMLAQ